MLNSLYTLFIRPQASNPDKRNRELVLNWLIASVICLLFVYSLNTLIRMSLLGKDYLFVRFLIINIILALLLIYTIKLRKVAFAQRIASIVLLLLIYGSGLFITFSWSIVAVFGALMFGLFIVMSGILINARYSLYAAVTVCLTLIALEYLRTHKIITPDLSWTSSPVSMGDVVNSMAVFFVLAWISWLFNKQMEDSLNRARLSELELKKERDMLEEKVEERTRALQEAQLEKVQQVYRFAELGHLSTALFHDLAGNLSSLSIDIESMRRKNRSDFTQRIDSNIQYIDNVVRRVKSQLRGKDTVETFNVVAETKDLVGILSYNARKARTHISLETSTDKIYYVGNLTRFRQLIINLLSNAIEAYPPDPSASVKDRPVIIKISETKKMLILKVVDHGRGIQKSTKTKMFEPFYTTKTTGSGIGLFIVKQVTESDFSGSIKISSSRKNGTVFTVKIPK